MGGLGPVITNFDGRDRVMAQAQRHYKLATVFLQQSQSPWPPVTGTTSRASQSTSLALSAIHAQLAQVCVTALIAAVDLSPEDPKPPA